MIKRAARVLVSLAILAGSASAAAAALPPDVVPVRISSPMAPPDWALKERLLLAENERAVVKFFQRYWDDRSYLKVKARWSIVDGVDDSMENCGGWPLL